MLDIAFAAAALPTSGTLVLPAIEGEALSPLTRQADEATGGAVSRAIAASEFKGAKGKSVTIPGPGAGLSRIVVIGLGKRHDLTARVVEDAGGSLVAQLAAEPVVAVDAGGLSVELAAALAMGATLRGYRFDRYRTKEKAEDKPKLAGITILAADAAQATAAYVPMRAVADGIFLSRDLITEPPNVLFPAEMADRCQKLSSLGVEVEVFGPTEMTELGFGALMGVSYGSATEPRMVVMHWNNGGDAKPVAFVGKGVTFDTGGISIKPASGMEDMKWDMAGAGAVVGLMAALAGRKAKVNAIGLVGLVENMPSGSAMRPGDVLTSYSGQTIEVINTDAEGRLVLADVLWYCQQKFDPQFMVNLATLTGAIIVGLGHEHAGLFSNDDNLCEKLTAAGRATGEKLWRMPMSAEYDKVLKSEIADMKNVGGGRAGGSITAAQFIERFVNGKPWAHLDIAGMAWTSKDAPTIPKGAAAFGVRLLDRMVADNFETE